MTVLRGWLALQISRVAIALSLLALWVAGIDPDRAGTPADRAAFEAWRRVHRGDT